MFQFINIDTLDFRVSAIECSREGYILGSTYH